MVAWVARTDQKRAKVYKVSSNQKRSGIVLSYLCSAASLLGSLVLTPFLISRLGTESFGLYQLALGFAGYLIVLNMGMRTIVTRQVAVAVVEGDDKKLEERLSSVIYVLGLALGLLLLGGVVSYFLLGQVFARTLDAAQLRSVEIMFVLAIVNLAGQFIADVPLGILLGFESFKLLYGLMLLRVVSRIPLIILLVELGCGPEGVVLADAAVSLCFVPLAWFSALRRCQVRIRFSGWNSRLVRRILAFGGALSLGIVSTQVNMAVSKVIVGAFLGPSEVSSYAVAQTIYTGFVTVTMSLGTVFVPNAVKLVTSNSSRVQLTQFIAKPGRLQLMIGACALTLFLLHGKTLIAVWVGADLQTAWLPAMLLCIPALFVSVETVCFAVMDAHQKRLVRSLVALGAAAMSMVLTLVWVPAYGITGAALACGLGVMCGDVLIMNTYYHRRLNIDVGLLSKLLLRGTGPVIIGTLVLFFGISRWAPETALSVLVQGVAFVCAYGIGMYYFSMLPAEREEVRHAWRLIRKSGGA